MVQRNCSSSGEKDRWRNTRITHGDVTNDIYASIYEREAILNKHFQIICFIQHLDEWKLHLMEIKNNVFTRRGNVFNLSEDINSILSKAIYSTAGRKQQRDIFFTHRTTRLNSCFISCTDCLTNSKEPSLKQLFCCWGKILLNVLN